MYAFSCSNPRALDRGEALPAVKFLAAGGRGLIPSMQAAPGPAWCDRVDLNQADGLAESRVSGADRSRDPVP